METNNPYAPPKAAVADVSTGNAPPRPAQVKRAVQLLWAALAVGLGSGLLNTFLLLPDGAALGSLLIMTLFSYAIAGLISWWILRSIGKGKNWARIVQLVFFIIGILSVFAMFTMPVPVSAIIWVLYVVQMSLALGGIVLLFSGPGGAWFREMKDWL